MTRRPFALAAALLALLLGPVRPASAEVFTDSTRSDAWRLANGLEVRTRHVPGAGGVLVSTGFRSGTLADPAGREGLAELLAEVQFHAATSREPDRSRSGLDSLRSLGWGSRVSPRLTVFTEVAAPGRLAAQLEESSARLRGVTVTPASLAAALAAVRRTAGERTLGIPELGLYSRVRDVASGTPDDVVITRATGQALGALTVEEVTALLRSTFVPANASLALVGDLSGLDVHKLVEAALGGIPAGAPSAIPADPVLAAGSRTARWPGLPRSLGAAGIIAPALDDSLHPAFLIASVFVGGYMREFAGPPKPPLTTRFQYSVLEEPELMRLYPEVAEGETDPAAVGATLERAFDKLREQVIMADGVEMVRARVDWLLGGPLPPALRSQARKAPYVLEPLASGMATRALWRGDDFWTRYRHAFESTRLMPDLFYAWMNAPAHQALLVLTPAR